LKHWSKRMRLYITTVIVMTVILMIRSQCPTGFNCVACNITNCDLCDTNITTCDSCSQGNYLMNNTCITCPTSCLVCGINTYCSKCMPGYDRTYNDAGDQICVFYWWKWFIIIFGTLLGVVLLGKYRL
jgi:hypothetical protein